MSETNKVMSSLQFPNNDQPYQVQDTRVPANPAPYQQLVTDGKGDWLAADRLAYKTFEPATITWDGNTDGLESVFGELFKVSSQVVSKDQLLGQTLTLKNSGSDQTINLDDTNVSEDGNGNVTIKFFGTNGVFSIKTPFSSEGVTLSEGLWFLRLSSDAYVSKLEYLSETTHPIPAEYIPRIVFAYDGTNYTCNVPFEKFRDVLMSGVPVVLVDTKEGALSMDAVVYTYEDADAAIHSEAFGWNLSYGEDGVSVPAAPPS